MLQNDRVRVACFASLLSEHFSLYKYDFSWEYREWHQWLTLRSFCLLLVKFLLKNICKS